METTKREKPIRLIEIDHKKRLRLLLSLLIVFNVILIGALTYLCVLIKTEFVVVLAVSILIFCVIRSVLTYVESKKDTKYEIYSNKIVCESMVYTGEIDLSKVYIVKTKKTLTEKIFKKPASRVLIYSKAEDIFKNVYSLNFIKEDAEKLSDEIMRLAIKAREKTEKKAIRVANKKQDRIEVANGKKPKNAKSKSKHKKKTISEN